LAFLLRTSWKKRWPSQKCSRVRLRGERAHGDGNGETVDLETLRTLLRSAWAHEISPEEAEKELLAGVA
jgi:hypothetical protein